MLIYRDEGVKKTKGKKTSQHAACHCDGDRRGVRTTRASQWKCGCPRLTKALTRGLCHLHCSFIDAPSTD